MKQKIQQALRELERLDADGASGPSRHNVLLSNFPPNAAFFEILSKSEKWFGEEASARLLSAWKRESTIR